MESSASWFVSSPPRGDGRKAYSLNVWVNHKSRFEFVHVRLGEWVGVASGIPRHITAWNCRLCLPEDGSEPRERAVARAAEFGFCRSMYFGAEDELNRASVDRKSRLGVPPPGHPYWTRELHTAVASRFPDGAWGEYGH